MTTDQHETADAVIPEPISWRRGNMRGMGIPFYSREHLMVDGADLALCGVRPPWGEASFGTSHSGACARCQAAAAKRA
jgi:hypothetical protein